MAIRCFDIFCGGGGSSRGAAMAGASIVGGLDAWDLAAKNFELNFSSAEVWNERAENVDPSAVLKKTGPVDLILASPECTSHSVAKGNAPRCEKSRATAFQVIRFASALNPRWIVVENVARMRTWHRFDEWLQELHDLGYKTNVAVIDSKDHRTPQSRRRLFVLCDKKSEPTMPPKVPGPKRTAARVLEAGTTHGEWTYRPLVKGQQAEATWERAQRAIAELGRKSDFIIVYYGTDGAGGFQSVDRPLRTITTLDRFAYVRPVRGGHEMRMLQPTELASAMGFPLQHKWLDVSRRDRIKLIGNAVCPPVMCDVVRHLTQKSRSLASVRR